MYADRPSNSTHRDILAPFVAEGLVTLAEAAPPPDPQIPTYDACVAAHRDAAQWLAFTDVDEFLFPADPASTLQAELRAFEPFSAVVRPAPLPRQPWRVRWHELAPNPPARLPGRQVVPWTLFGSSGLRTKTGGLVIDRRARPARPDAPPQRARATRESLKAVRPSPRSFLMRRALPECNGDTCAYKAAPTPAPARRRAPGLSGAAGRGGAGRGRWSLRPRRSRRATCTTTSTPTGAARARATGRCGVRGGCLTVPLPRCLAVSARGARSGGADGARARAAGRFAVNERRARMHDDASLLPTESQARLVPRSPPGWRLGG
jgi:hypothetical protein